MSSGLNKEWINDDNLDSEAYHTGIYNFILFLIGKSGKDEYHPCPCRSLNGSGQFNLDDISVHLLNHGMDKSYVLWYFHGEHNVGEQRQDEAPADNVEVMELDVLPAESHVQGG
ncbi:hypothetical protein ACHQM5_004958 [Ranunculus cassubicifolius]